MENQQTGTVHKKYDVASKKPYTRPQLAQYGNISALTQGVGSRTNDMNGSQSGKG